PLAADPAPLVAVPPVVQVRDLVDGVTRQEGRGAGLPALSRGGQVAVLLGAVDLQLVQAWFAAVLCRRDRQPDEPGLRRRELVHVPPGIDRRTGDRTDALLPQDRYSGLGVQVRDLPGEYPDLPRRLLRLPPRAGRRQ